MIKESIVKILFGLFVLSFVAQACSKKISISNSQSGINITSLSPQVPLFKGVSSNQLLRICIYVPENAVISNFNQITGVLNKAGVAAIDSLNVYFTGQEPMFSTDNLIAAAQPSLNFNIPVRFSLKPGMNYIWLGAKLNESADIDQKIDFEVKDLVDDFGKKHTIVAEKKTVNSKPIGVALRKIGDDGVHTYRIPGMVTTDKGTLISVYDIRYTHPKDLPSDIDVGMNRSTDGGRTWEAMKVIMDMGEPHDNNGIGDPTILFDPVTKKIWVAALWSKGNKSIAGSRPGLAPDETGQFVLVSSDDDGLTWSVPINITSQVKNPAWNLFFNGPGNGIVMQDGKLVFPAQYWDEKRMPHSNLIYSDDHGLTWKSSIGAKSNTTESQIVETEPGTLMLNMRDNRGRFRSVATTKDMGKTWLEHPTSFNTLQDPVCMASFIKANVIVKGKSKEVLFFGNQNNSYERYDMTLKASLDLGESWPSKLQLLIDERKSFGYSALTRIDENTLGLLYEGRRELYFLRIPVSDILN